MMKLWGNSQNRYLFFLADLYEGDSSLNLRSDLISLFVLYIRPSV